MLKKLFAPSGFRISILVTFIFASVFMTNYLGLRTDSYLELMDKKLVDLIIRARSSKMDQTDVAIIAVDTKSVDKYGRWPWGRNIMAKLLHELNHHYQAKVIGFDMVFSETDPNDVAADQILSNISQTFRKESKGSKELNEKFKKIYSKIASKVKNDKIFGAELSKLENVVLGYFFFATDERLKHMTTEELESSAERIERSEITIIQGAQYLDTIPLPTMQAVESNIPDLSSSNNLNGFFNMFPDPEDGTVRRVHLVLKYKDKYYPSLDLQILKKFYNSNSIRMVVNEGSIYGFYLDDKLINTDSDGSVMINYRGDRMTFSHYSVYDVINKKVPKEALKDKILILGATEVGIYDLRTTPVGIDYPGVEVHASIIDNIIKGDYFYNSDLVDFLTFILILVFGLTVGLVLSKLRALPGLIFSVLILVGYISLNLWFFINEKTWTSFVYIICVIIINWFAVVLFKFFGEEKDKRFIKGAFQQYLSPKVIDQLVENPGMLKLGGEKKELTAFFSDIQGFSTISESLTPEELVVLLNEYLTAMTDIILKHGGTVDKFEGDAIIAFFGAPISHEDHALRCVLAALDMQKKLIEMRENWRKQGRHEILVRIGINTGEMVVGNMGSAYRMDYTMMGDSVNLAARLEGVNKEYKTFNMISEFTYEAVKDQVDTRELDLIRVVGKNKPVRIYEVLGVKGEISEETIHGYKYFSKGLNLYRKQQWEEAIKYFMHTIKLSKSDGPSETFIKRCQYFKENPLTNDWDGVFSMTSK
ncbi:MAG: CHASE2 domain-containing protein [Deltaproteobacteria bacterium]|jgi:adenylate cyclase|nr:CHASE2 domain-containing protein [Deltaproteobacteria bacterium]MBT4525692.1 CHASE2 domain-containing protein [Deltaproteobacteria bacterium]